MRHTELGEPEPGIPLDGLRNGAGLLVHAGALDETILVTNACGETVWLRFTDRPEATEGQMLERKAYEARPDEMTTVNGSVLAPADGRQGSMAVSAASDVVGMISPLPLPVGEEIRVTVAGEDCPR